MSKPLLFQVSGMFPCPEPRRQRCQAGTVPTSVSPWCKRCQLALSSLSNPNHTVQSTRGDMATVRALLTEGPLRHGRCPHVCLLGSRVPPLPQGASTLPPWADRCSPMHTDLPPSVG
ncbi:hypothetical protein SKAU_G00108510 [Synaphobranchus kaupii]|uniref:Uncharacterized protein n=1 Tax=Synaphobranchus kaupii TaxID=118154 RepID=A0A9Q1FZT3_SYNKA|nr:hypothetical protein SKAU_G00108510 [Synaphobranchus kaupii]